MSERGSQYYSACDVCRARKFKCTKEWPNCASCLQLGLQCKYSLKISRTALTRSNLTAAEDRVEELETAFAALFPAVGLDTILSSVRSGATSKTAGEKKTKKTPTGTPQNEQDSGLAAEALPRGADGFDWAESAASMNELSDGMAALSVDPEGAGYLGATSSVVPLRAMLGKAKSVADDFPSLDGWPGQFVAQNRMTQNLHFSNISEITFIDAYFQWYHPTYPFLHEPSFRAQFAGTSSRPEGHSWLILLNAVLALGAWCIGNDNSVIDDFFYQKIAPLWEDRSIFEAGNLALVQALLLLSNYTQKRNRPNTGWNCLGLAVRMGLSLGLHKEFPNWQITPLQREMRRRVWWGLFIFDSGASITFGRPILLPETGIMDVRPVLNIQEECLTPDTLLLPSELSSPTIYMPLISQSLFHSTTNSVYHRLISIPAPTPQELLELNTKITTWEDSVPPYFQFSFPEIASNPILLFARYRLAWRSWNLQIILFRPVILRWVAVRRTSQDARSLLESQNAMNDKVECRQRCFSSAQATIDSISDFLAAGISSRLSTWYMLCVALSNIYFLFQAGLVPLICLSSDPTNEDSALWLKSIHTTKELLTSTAVKNQLASRCLAVFERLCSPIVGVGEMDPGIPNTGLWGVNFENFPTDQLGGMEFWDWTNDGMNWTL